MKITKLHCDAVHIPFPQPIGHGLRGSDCVLAYLETDEGVVGEGFICTLKREFTKVLYEMVKSLEPLIVGIDPQMSGSFSAKAWESVGFIGVAGVSVMGIAAVDCALWDLRGMFAPIRVEAMHTIATGSKSFCGSKSRERNNAALMAKGPVVVSIKV